MPSPSQTVGSNKSVKTGSITPESKEGRSTTSSKDSEGELRFVRVTPEKRAEAANLMRSAHREVGDESNADSSSLKGKDSSRKQSVEQGKRQHTRTGENQKPSSTKREVADSSNPRGQSKQSFAFGKNAGPPTAGNSSAMRTRERADPESNQNSGGVLVSKDAAKKEANTPTVSASKDRDSATVPGGDISGVVVSNNEVDLPMYDELSSNQEKQSPSGLLPSQRGSVLDGGSPVSEEEEKAALTYKRILDQIGSSSLARIDDLRKNGGEPVLLSQVQQGDTIPLFGKYNGGSISLRVNSLKTVELGTDQNDADQPVVMSKLSIVFRYLDADGVRRESAPLELYNLKNVPDDGCMPAELAWNIGKQLKDEFSSRKVSYAAYMPMLTSSPENGEKNPLWMLPVALMADEYRDVKNWSKDGKEFLEKKIKQDARQIHVLVTQDHRCMDSFKELTSLLGYEWESKDAKLSPLKPPGDARDITKAPSSPKATSSPITSTQSSIPAPPRSIAVSSASSTPIQSTAVSSASSTPIQSTAVSSASSSPIQSPAVRTKIETSIPFLFQRLNKPFEERVSGLEEYDSLSLKNSQQLQGAARNVASSLSDLHQAVEASSDFKPGVASPDFKPAEYYGRYPEEKPGRTTSMIYPKQESSISSADPRRASMALYPTNAFAKTLSQRELSREESALQKQSYVLRNTLRPALAAMKRSKDNSHFDEFYSALDDFYNSSISMVGELQSANLPYRNKSASSQNLTNTGTGFDIKNLKTKFLELQGSLDDISLIDTVSKKRNSTSRIITPDRVSDDKKRMLFDENWDFLIQCEAFCRAAEALVDGKGG